MLHPTPFLSFTTLTNQNVAAALGLQAQIIVSVCPLLVNG